MELIDPIIPFSIYFFITSSLMARAVIERFGIPIWLGILIGLAAVVIEILIIVFFGIILGQKICWLGCFFAIYAIIFFIGLPFYVWGHINLFTATVIIPILGYVLTGIFLLIEYIDYKVYEYRKKKANIVEKTS